MSGVAKTGRSSCRDLKLASKGAFAVSALQKHQLRKRTYCKCWFSKDVALTGVLPA